MGAVGIIFSSSSLLIAGGIDHLHNYSAEYIRSLNRNASTDSADAVAYNPAGVMKMDDGLYANLSVQHILKDYAHMVGGTEYDSDTPSTIPGLFGLYKESRCALFTALTIPSGGGKVEYDDGSVTSLALGQAYMAGANALIGFPFYDSIRNQEVEAEKYYMGFTFGLAYSFNDVISISIGTRYIDARKETQGAVTIGASSGGASFDQTAEIDYEETADGWGAIVGINISPSKELNIGARYETRTKLDFETDVDRDDLGILVDGSKARRDLPALLALGVSVRSTPNIRIESNLTYYLNENAKWNGLEKNVNNGYDLGIAFEYTFTPRLKGSLGYMYTDGAIKPDDMAPEAPELDGHTISTGLCYKYTDNLHLNFGLGRTFYSEVTTSTGINYEKKVYLTAFGIQYKFL